MAPAPPLLSHLPENPDPDDLLVGFLDFAAEVGIELYPAQEEAILELMAGHNVVLNTPTGSGKSLVAMAAHFAALGRGERSFYTAPIKALVSEKFFSLCRDFGSENVGMMTGDAAVNPSAPIICCTAEILANMALRDGDQADVDWVIIDEFHYYSDRDRGWAWQVPLLELPQAQFLLMSATLGSTELFENELTTRTGRETMLVRTDDRPVPLEFVYRETPLHESIEELLETRLAPVYIVQFTQRAATEQAQALMSLQVLTKEEKEGVKAAISGFRFDSPFGKDLRKFLLHGVGVHHAGLLPKYRLLVEKLAQDGHLKIISGTDTLGVGINVPIRTVLFSALCKYDGHDTRILTVRDFKQIAGRAGRKGFDDQGSVWVQAPPHAIENKRAEIKARDRGRKTNKLVKKKPPEWGYAHWNEDTMTRLSTSEPEQLTSSFSVSHGMLLNMLDRPGDGGAAMRRLLVENHDSRRRQRSHIRRAIAIYRSLVDADIIEVLEDPDDQGRRIRVSLELQSDFRLNQPLSPFVVDAVAVLEGDEDELEAIAATAVRPTNARDVVDLDEDDQLVTIGAADVTDRRGRVPVATESELEADAPYAELAEHAAEDLSDPATGLDAESEVSSEAAESVESESAEAESGSDRSAMAEPDEPAVDARLHAEPPRNPALDVLTVVEAVLEDPGVVLAAQINKMKGDLVAELKSQGMEYEQRMERLDEVEHPKPLADFLYGAFQIFSAEHPWVGGEAIKPKSVARDLYERAMTFREYVTFYGLKRSEGVLLRYLSDVYKGLVQNVPETAKTDEVYDLIDWIGELVRQVDSSLLDEWAELLDPDESAQVDEVRPRESDDPTRNRGFGVVVRNTAFRWVMLLSRRRYDELAESLDGGMAASAIREAFSPFFEEHKTVYVDADARNDAHFVSERTGDTWTVRQFIADPEESMEWRIEAHVDVQRSRDEGYAVVVLDDIVRLAG